jgi:MoaA/NifB/PqqE/SkfB family radical SAM enzyme
MIPSFVNVDIEPTNRCNADCYFCPRDQTPHQGLMRPEVFDQALARSVEFREIARDRLSAEMRVSLCGLGEPLLNRNAASFVRSVREAGLHCSMASNGSLLDERRSEALLEAGLQQININAGEEGRDYEDVYNLPFERTCENIVRFVEMAGDQCEVHIVLVDHRADKEHHARMMEFWRERGLEHFLTYPIMNRGGALFVDHMQYEGLQELSEARAMLSETGAPPLCYAPFFFLFIGYDGQYYLCCSDWKKEVPLGSVFDRSFLEITREKLDHVLSREPICKQCNLDPLNQLTGEILAEKSGGATAGGNRTLMTDAVNPGAMRDALAADSRALMDRLEQLQPGVTDLSPPPPRQMQKRLIPLRVE